MSVDLGQFTQEAQVVLRRSEELARESGRRVVDETHLLLAILEQEESLTVSVLKELGVDYVALRGFTETTVFFARSNPLGIGEDVGFNRATQQILDAARQRAGSQSRDITTEDIVVCVDHSSWGTAEAILLDADVDLELFAQIIASEN